MAMRRRTAERQGGRRSGQAIVELAIALVAVVVIVAALLQIGTLSRVHLDTINEAREEAAVYSLSPSYASATPGPTYLAGWMAGGDGATYSRDDTPVPGNPATVTTEILQPTKPALLDVYAPGNDFSGLANLDPVVDGFGLVRGRGRSRPVVLLPVVRHLLYARDTVTLEASAWSVWLRDIY
jgi:hypothetical protein